MSIVCLASLKAALDVDLWQLWTLWLTAGQPAG